MAKWIVTEDSGSWTVHRNGCSKATLGSENQIKRWLKKHCPASDKIFLREDDGYLSKFDI